MVKVATAYPHESGDLRPFHLAIAKREPTEDDWRPALRDTVAGRPVLWARFPAPPQRGEQLWMRHGGEVRQVARL